VDSLMTRGIIAVSTLSEAEKEKHIKRIKKYLRDDKDIDYSSDSTTCSTLVNRFRDNETAKDEYFTNKNKKLEDDVNKALTSNNRLESYVDKEVLSSNEESIYQRYEDKKIAIKNREEEAVGTLLDEKVDNNDNKKNSTIDFVLDKVSSEMPDYSEDMD
jgi:hypothetical protein